MLCIHVHTKQDLYTYIYIYVCIHKHTHTHIYIYIYACMQAYMHRYAYNCITHGPPEAFGVCSLVKVVQEPRGIDGADVLQVSRANNFGIYEFRGLASWGFRDL